MTFPLKRCERLDARVICSVVKDAGDDPDCTHGAELVAEVEWKTEPGIELRGGEGVARVTKPGLGLEVGSPAINPGAAAKHHGDGAGRARRGTRRSGHDQRAER